MADYINRDDALTFEMEIEADMDEIQPITKGMALYGDYLKQLPRITVTRCQECEYLTPSVWQKGKGHCCRFGIMRPFDWFCADGRKEEDETTMR